MLYQRIRLPVRVALRLRHRCWPTARDQVRVGYRPLRSPARVLERGLCSRRSILRESIMADLHSAVPTPRNRLLAALPATDLTKLWPLLKPVELGLREIIQVPDEPIMAVYFPESGWVSMMALLVDGNSAEVGLVGHEGMIGLPLLLGSDRSPIEAMVQASGTLLRLDAESFRHALESSTALRTLLLRYALAFHAPGDPDRCLQWTSRP